MGDGSQGGSGGWGTGTGGGGAGGRPGTLVAIVSEGLPYTVWESQGRDGPGAVNAFTSSRGVCYSTRSVPPPPPPPPPPWHHCVHHHHEWCWALSERNHFGMMTPGVSLPTPTYTWWAGRDWWLEGRGGGECCGRPPTKQDKSPLNYSRE